MPHASEAQGYVFAVGAQFAKYQGVAALPTDTSIPTGIETAVLTDSITPAPNT